MPLIARIAGRYDLAQLPHPLLHPHLQLQWPEAEAEGAVDVLDIDIILLDHSRLLDSSPGTTPTPEHELRLSPPGAWLLDRRRSHEPNTLSSSHPNALLELTFTGNAVYLSSPSSPGPGTSRAQGQIQACLNCTPPELFSQPVQDLYAHTETNQAESEADNEHRVVVWSRTGLGEGRHTLLVGRSPGPGEGEGELLLSSMHYTRSINTTTTTTTMAPSDRMHMTVVLAVCLPLVALLLIWITLYFLRRRWRARQAPSQMFAVDGPALQNHNGSISHRLRPGHYLRLKWPQKFSWSRLRGRKDVVTPYRLPPVGEGSGSGSETSASSDDEDDGLDGLEMDSRRSHSQSHSQSQSQSRSHSHTHSQSHTHSRSLTHSRSWGVSQPSSTYGTYLHPQPQPQAHVSFDPSLASRPPQPPPQPPLVQRHPSDPSPLSQTPATALDIDIDTYSPIFATSPQALHSARVRTDPPSRRASAAGSFARLAHRLSRTGLAQAREQKTSHITPYELPPIGIGPAQPQAQEAEREVGRHNTFPSSSAPSGRHTRRSRTTGEISPPGDSPGQAELLSPLSANPARKSTFILGASPDSAQVGYSRSPEAPPPLPAYAGGYSMRPLRDSKHPSGPGNSHEGVGVEYPSPVYAPPNSAEPPSASAKRQSGAFILGGSPTHAQLVGHSPDANALGTGTLLRSASAGGTLILNPLPALPPPALALPHPAHPHAGHAQRPSLPRLDTGQPYPPPAPPTSFSPPQGTASTSDPRSALASGSTAYTPGSDLPIKSPSGPGASTSASASPEERRGSVSRDAAGGEKTRRPRGSRARRNKGGEAAQERRNRPKTPEPPPPYAPAPGP
ncbi:hypothetical protein CALVIDRAFT_533132 [Calocera viscosa TUFC12733]|uniref:Uncharacterized protein n=1 Tax=Calocera viscosa (strain TUFC12733) TaxID=1330018 RepID=A0A167RDN3_CALVF|nr:hypothetical protein CALVIDRAFT_533132 [Calocera viscosa TUFC12733]